MARRPVAARRTRLSWLETRRPHCRPRAEVSLAVEGLPQVQVQPVAERERVHLGGE